VKILPIELAKYIVNKETGLFIFQNKSNEFVRVFLRNGEILKIDGLYGEGEPEIARLFLWGEGDVIKRELPKEFENYIPSKKYDINGFLKIIVESIKKERKVEKIPKSEIIFNAYLNYLKITQNFLEYKKEEWIGFSKLIEQLSKSIKSAIISISDKYICFFENKIEFIISKAGYVNLDKIEEENLFEPFEYKVYIFSPDEFDIISLPFTKKPDYEGIIENVNLNDFVIGIVYDENFSSLYIKNSLIPQLKDNLYCMLWKLN